MENKESTRLDSDCVWAPKLDVSTDPNADQFSGYRPPEVEEEESKFRLELSVVIGGGRKANAYYNWSGFTETALDYLHLMIRNRNMEMYPKESDMALVMRMLSLTGAGMLPSISVEERLQLLDINYPLTNGANDGVIEITDEGMMENDRIANRHVLIDYDRKIVEIGDMFEEIEPDELEENGWTESDIVDWPYDEFGGFEIIRFPKVAKVRKFVKELAENNQIVRYNGYLFHSIY